MATIAPEVQHSQAKLTCPINIRLDLPLLKSALGPGLMYESINCPGDTSLLLLVAIDRRTPPPARHHPVRTLDPPRPVIIPPPSASRASPSAVWHEVAASHLLR